jgi:hypothetical protein
MSGKLILVVWDMELIDAKKFRSNAGAKGTANTISIRDYLTL